MEDKPTYFAEERALNRAYWEAVGDCLELRIQVHVRGEMKCLGTMRDEVRQARDQSTPVL